MNKALFVTHNSRFLVQFEMNDIRILQSMGLEVHCATNFRGEMMRKDAEKTLTDAGVICHSIDIERSPFKLGQNIRAVFELRQLMRQEKFALVHCHTPMGGVVGRLAANAEHVRPVMYTAHGFHFYKGCPLQNRLIYEPIESTLAHITDAQLTINREDYAAAQKFKLRGKAYYLPGIGVDVEKLSHVPVDRKAEREKLGIPEDAYVFVSVGELNKNKNHLAAIHAFEKTAIPNAYYLICGTGPLAEYYRVMLEEKGLTDKVKLLGFRSDVSEILRACDCFVFPSHREGLSVSLMEAMAAGLLCIASRIRGNVDLLSDSRYLFDPVDEATLGRLMQEAAAGVQTEEEKEKNRVMIQKYDVSNASRCMKEIYETMLKMGDAK